jgi:hypothetical protein
LQRYRDLLEERLAEIEPPLDHRARLARQLLLLIEGATAVAAIDGPDRVGADAHDPAAALIAAATPADSHVKRAARKSLHQR